MAHDPQDPQHARDPQPHRTAASPSSPGARPVPGPGGPVALRPDGGPEPQVTPLDTSTAGVPVIPPEEKPLDPRQIARESLAASRNWSLWLVVTGLVVACVVATVRGGAAGALVIAAILAMSAVVRAVVPEPAPVALAVRARALDVAVLTGLAVGIGILSQAIPTS
ncbi:DUF3017 domain-containing protein [Cellulomonas cellasea]|uniref:DUF3017 domain-containing protein n=2 Tax=Cellulomonas cellasea TaxID=43670 RepID=A0A0A0B951_9CELL|nr:DUF3017 domain-containing protein [Cellulomonas cellasea]KGM01786.1 hypothetical protein Q760_17460 [Cellulomonas cellasea DSM 20118]GEA86184.1 hypothetical protein CCE01nite_01330 [Cellulomonas cellasea]